MYSDLQLLLRASSYQYSLCVYNYVGGATEHHNRPITIAEVVPDGPAIRYA